MKEKLLRYGYILDKDRYDISKLKDARELLQDMLARDPDNDAAKDRLRVVQKTLLDKLMSDCYPTSTPINSTTTATTTNAIHSNTSSLTHTSGINDDFDDDVELI